MKDITTKNRVNKLVIILFIFLFATNLRSNQDSAKSLDPKDNIFLPEVDKIESSTIYFKKGLMALGGNFPEKIQTSLFDLTLLASTKEVASNYWFLLSARECQNCDADLKIYGIKPLGGKSITLTYPGKINDFKTGKLILESRGFFGRCLRRSTQDVYVAFQKDRVDRRNSLQPSVLIVKPGVHFFEEELMIRRLPKITETLQLVGQKKCQEIVGRVRVSSKTLIALRYLSKEGIPDEPDQATDTTEAISDVSSGSDHP